MKCQPLAAAAVLFALSVMPAAAHHSYADPYCPKNTTYSAYPSSSYRTEKASTVDIDITPTGLFFGFLFIIVLAAIMTTTSSSSSKDEAEPSVGLLPSETPEHYDQEAARKRAYARLLDADAVLIESQTRLALKQDENNEVGSFLRDKNSGRRR